MNSKKRTIHSTTQGIRAVLKKCGCVNKQYVIGCGRERSKWVACMNATSFLPVASVMRNRRMTENWLFSTKPCSPAAIAASAM